jgi:hypothetical protein
MHSNSSSGTEWWGATFLTQSQDGDEQEGEETAAEASQGLWVWLDLLLVVPLIIAPCSEPCNTILHKATATLLLTAAAVKGGLGATDLAELQLAPSLTSTTSRVHH